MRFTENNHNLYRQQRDRWRVCTVQIELSLSITQSFNATRANKNPIPTTSLSTHSLCYRHETLLAFLLVCVVAYLTSQTPPVAQCSSFLPVRLSLSCPTCSIRDKVTALCGRVCYGTNRCSSARVPLLCRSVQLYRHAARVLFEALLMEASDLALWIFMLDFYDKSPYVGSVWLSYYTVPKIFL